MKHTTLKRETIDNIQLYATVCELHPLLELEFNKQLFELEHKQKLCCLPHIILQRYNDKFKHLPSIKTLIKSSGYSR